MLRDAVCRLGTQRGRRDAHAMPIVKWIVQEGGLASVAVMTAIAAAAQLGYRLSRCLDDLIRTGA